QISAMPPLCLWPLHLSIASSYVVTGTVLPPSPGRPSAHLCFSANPLRPAPAAGAARFFAPSVVFDQGGASGADDERAGFLKMIGAIGHLAHAPERTPHGQAARAT